MHKQSTSKHKQSQLPPKQQPPVETDEERKKYFDRLYCFVAAGFASRLEVINEESLSDRYANSEDERMEDSARRAHLFTWHLMRQRDIAAFNEKVFAYNEDSSEPEDDGHE
jgi:hypothetical protein